MDDKELFNVSADEFLEKVQKYVWSEEKVDEYCGFNENENKTEARDNDDDDSDDAKKAYKALMIVFICLSAILLAFTIFLGYKLSQKNATRPPIHQSYIQNNQTNISTASNDKNWFC